MARTVYIIWVSCLIALIAPAPSIADESPATVPQSEAAYAAKRDQIDAYEGLLRKDLHTSRVDLVVLANTLPGNDWETHFGGSILFRPFATEPVLANQIIREYRLYMETAAQTGLALSDDAVARVERIVEAVSAYRTRPAWRRIVGQFGVNIPYDPIQNEPVDLGYFATVGYEIDERVVISAGSTLGEDPRLVLSVGFSAGSDLYAAGYASLERFERVLTDRRIYQTIDHSPARPFRESYR